MVTKTPAEKAAWRLTLPCRDIFQFLVQAHIAVMAAGRNLPRPHRLKHSAAILLGVAAPYKPAPVQIGTKLQKCLRQPFLQFQVQFLGVKGTKSRRIDDLRAASQAVQFHMARGMAAPPQLLADSSHLQGEIGSIAFKMLDFPTPEFPVKAESLPDILSRSSRKPSPVSALTHKVEKPA